MTETKEELEYVQERIDLIKQLMGIQLELSTSHDVRPVTIYNGVTIATHDYVKYSVKVNFENNRKLLPLLYNTNEHIIFSNVDDIWEIIRGLDAICTIFSLGLKVQEQNDKEEQERKEQANREEQQSRMQLREIEGQSLGII